MATARKPARRTTSARADPTVSKNGQRRSDSTANARGTGRMSLRAVAVAAAAELADLIGHTPEGIVAVEKSDDGWRVQVEVVESRRIPETTDILAIYEVDVDTDGAVTGYRRLNRYVRGRIQE